MRIKFTTPIAGSNFSHSPGDEVDWPDDAEAQRYIESGQAVPAGPAPQTATRPTSELRTAAKDTTRNGGGRRSGKPK